MKKTIGRKIFLIMLVVSLLSVLLQVTVSAKTPTAPRLATSWAYNFKSVRTGAGGGFLVAVIFHPTQPKPRSPTGQG
jgi:hypothetical protein